MQIDNLGDATLDDVTQEWIDSKIQNYECTVQEDASISGKKIIMQKDGIIMKFILDEKFEITKIEDDGSSTQLTYEIQSREGDNVKILITITDKENGIKQIQFPDGDIGYYTGEEQKEENGKTYVTKLVHPGTPENFVFYYTTSYDAYRAQYLLTGNANGDKSKTLSNEIEINPRNWDMYKDKELDAKGYIKEVHVMTYDEALAITGSTSNSNGIRNTGSCYWLGAAYFDDDLRYVFTSGKIDNDNNSCWGVRPVVILEDGVYIVSGDGTEESPYVLAKE